MSCRRPLCCLVPICNLHSLPPTPQMGRRMGAQLQPSLPVPHSADGEEHAGNWLRLIIDGEKIVELRGNAAPQLHIGPRLLLVASKGYPSNQRGIRYVVGTSSIVDSCEYDEEMFEAERTLHRWPGSFESACRAARVWLTFEQCPCQCFRPISA